MPREVRWERMFPDELEAAFAACPLLYLPYGLCEPHGPQNALGLDGLKAHAICRLAASAHGGIVAPPFYWHIHEMGSSANWAQRTIGNVGRSWLTAIPAWIWFKNLCYHIRTADHMGFHAALLVSGHGGAHSRDLDRFIDLVQPHVGTQLRLMHEFDLNLPGFDNDNNSRIDHAGRVETSLLWALEPDCVDVTRLPAAGAPGPHFAMGDNASQANRRTGERMATDIVRNFGPVAQELLDRYAALKPQHQLHSFEDVEQLWEKHVRPALLQFNSMQNTQDAVPQNSTWYTNWKIPTHRG